MTAFETAISQEDQQKINNSIVINKITQSVVDNICSAEVPKSHKLPIDPNMMSHKFLGRYPDHKDPELLQVSKQVLDNTLKALSSITDIKVRLQNLHELIFYDPNCHLIYFHIANTYMELGQCYAARSFYALSLILNKNDVSSLFNLATIYELIDHEYSLLIIKKIDSVSTKFNNTEKDPEKLKTFNDFVAENKSKLRALNESKKSGDNNICLQPFVNNKEINDTLEKYLIIQLLFNDHMYTSEQLRTDIQVCTPDIMLYLNSVLNAETTQSQSQSQSPSSQSKKEDQRMTMLNKLFYSPNNAILLYNIGLSFEEENNLTAARSYFHAALVVNPFLSEAMTHMAVIFRHINVDMSIQILHKVLDFYPNDFATKNTIGVLYNDSHNYEKAIKYVEESVNTEGVTQEIKITSLSNLATITSSSGNNYKALEYLEQSLILAENERKINPSNIYIGLNTLQIKLMTYNNIICDNHLVFKEHLKINNYFEHLKRYYPVKYVKGSLKNKEVEDQDRIIKIGYVSADLKNHVVSKFMIDLLRNHDKTKFEIYIYAISKVNDDIANVHKTIVKEYIGIEHLSTEDAAKKIYEDKIDILFDLNGHTNGARMGIFAQKPAPIQISYLGYPNTSGLHEIDFRITDKIADNVESKQLYTEKLIYMPNCFLLYNPLIYNPILGFGVIEPQKNESLDRVPVIGMLNRPAKNSKEYYNAVIKILKNAPNSKVLIKFKSSCNVEDERVKLAKKLSVSKGRVLVYEYQKENDSYYDIFNKIDILLDTFCYSGTTSTCDCLYMSVPLITLYNKDLHVQSVSSSILSSIGHTELIANTEQEYVDKTVELLNDIPRINEYKQTLRSKFLNTQNPKQFTKDFEDLLVSCI